MSQPSRSNWCACVTQDGNNFGFHFIRNLSGLENTHILECCQIKRHFIIPVAWFKKENKAVLFMVFVEGFGLLWHMRKDAVNIEEQFEVFAANLKKKIVLKKKPRKVS